MPECIYIAHRVHNRDMVTYCIGSARQKRAYFKKDGDALVLDNLEVVFCVSENGRNYFAYADVPFSSFTVKEYLAYRRALCPKVDYAHALERLRIPEHVRLGRLSPAQMRSVMFVEKTGGGKCGKVVINLDGAKCTRKNVKALRRLLFECPDAYVCITDERFIKRVGLAHSVLSFGASNKKSRPEFYRARLLAQKLNVKHIAVM